MKSKLSLEYIEFVLLGDNAVRAEFTTQLSYKAFFIPIIDDCRSYDCLSSMLGLISSQYGTDCHVSFRPGIFDKGFCLESAGDILKLNFSSSYVDKDCVMYKLCKSYL